MNLDRFSQGLPDPAEERPMATCDRCRCEIYPGDMVYVVEGDVLCGDACLVAAVGSEYLSIEEVLDRSN